MSNKDFTREALQDFPKTHCKPQQQGRHYLELVVLKRSQTRCTSVLSDMFFLFLGLPPEQDDLSWVQTILLLKK